MRTLIFSALYIGLNELITSLAIRIPDILEFRNNEESTPLIYAAQTYNLTLFSRLLEAGANPDHVNKYKQNSLHYLCSYNPKDKSEGKRLTQVIKKAMTFTNVNQQDEDGFTALFSAILSEKVEVVKAHTRYNTDFNVETYKGNFTPFYFANRKVRDHAKDITPGENTLQHLNADHPCAVITRIVAEHVKNYWIKPEAIPLPHIDETSSTEPAFEGLDFLTALGDMMNNISVD